LKIIILNADYVGFGKSKLPETFYQKKKYINQTIMLIETKRDGYPI
jgi:hypothetical protein